LGRETAIQRIERNAEGWFRLASGGHLPQLDVETPGVADESAHCREIRYEFNQSELHDDFQWLRTPWPEEIYSLSERPAYLRLFGRESLGSHFYQALVARRQQHFSFQVETCLEFEPQHFQQMAGLVCYYNSSKFHYLYISRDDETGKHLATMSCEADISLDTTFPGYQNRTPLPENQAIWLRVTVQARNLVFSWSTDGKNWIELPQELDTGLLSDESGKDGATQFTGAFAGMCCQDLAGSRKNADFSFFSYRCLPDKE
jgi:xylan 1,4-beta-xylosidase